MFDIRVVIGLLVVDCVIDNDILRVVYVLFSTLPSLAARMRRLHDTDRSGWWLWLPIVNIIFLCQPGAQGTTGLARHLMMRKPEGGLLYASVIGA